MEPFTVSFELTLFICAWIIGFIAAGRITLFPLVVFLCSFIFAGVSASYENEIFVDELIKYTLLFCVGIEGLWRFIGHTFCTRPAAENMGWKTTPFQYQVGLANLGLCVLGTLSFWNSILWIPTILFVSIFYLGSVVIRIRERILNDNTAPGNTGWSLYTEILIPATLILAFLYKIDFYGV